MDNYIKAIELSVVIALIRRGDSILIAQRPLHVECGGYWEFPGGKCLPGEPYVDALRRECEEELGIVIHHPQHFTDVYHHTTARHLHLSAWTVREYTGEPQPLASLKCQWVRVATLSAYQFPIANAPIVRALMSGKEGGVRACEC